MGQMEKRREAIMRRTKLNKAIIAVVGTAGILALGAVAPGVIGALGKMRLLPQERYRIKTSLGRMIKKGYVEVEQQGGEKRVRLTEKGERFAALMHEGELKPKKQKRWDGKWRIVIYDLKKGTPVLRARVRELIQTFGFKMLQRSVWVSPYDCEDLIFILKQEFRLGDSLLYIIADDIEHDAPLRAHFKLPARH